MTTKLVTVLALVGGLSTTACDKFGQAMTAHTDVVARAAGRELKVDRTAAMISANPQIPRQPDVVLAVASLWTDYMLLGTAAARDSTLRNIPLDALVQPMVDQDIVNQLHERDIKPDTALTDAQLRQLFEQSGTGSEVRARHILLNLQQDATPAQRDSVTKLAQSLRQRAVGGADFAALARQYSGDGGTKDSGGDLGFFNRERMLKPFSDAAFALQPGQISEIVETPYGLHIIKLEERRSANFDEQKVMFRSQIQQDRMQNAYTTWLDNLIKPKKIEVQEGSYEVVKDLAARPETELRGRAASRALVSYQGGNFTARDYLEFLRRLNPQMRASIPQRSDEELKRLLEQMAGNKIQIEEAKRQKLTMPQSRLDSLKNGIYSQLVEITRSAGLINVQPQQGESREQAIERRVNTLLEGAIKGEQNLVPLGPLSYELRDKFKGEVFESTVPAVMSKLEAAQPPPQQPGPVPQLPPPTPPDTTRR